MSTSPPHPTTCTSPVPEDAVPAHGKLKWLLLPLLFHPREVSSLKDTVKHATKMHKECNLHTAVGFSTRA